MRIAVFITDSKGSTHTVHQFDIEQCTLFKGAYSYENKKLDELEVYTSSCKYTFEWVSYLETTSMKNGFDCFSAESYKRSTNKDKPRY